MRKKQPTTIQSFLPDGRHFLYLARRGGQPEDWDVFLASLDSEERRLLPGIQSGVRYSPSGHLVFIRDQTLMAHPFDLDRLELTGEAFPVAQGVRGPRPSFSISMNGSLAYLAVAVGLESQLAWFDRTGRQRSEASPTGEYTRMHLSPDGKQVVFDRVDGRLAPDIFLLDIEKGSPSLFVSGAAADFAPVWSPDGRTIAFASSREPTGNASPTNITAGNLYQRAVGVVGEDKVLFKSAAGKLPTDWSRDGRYLTYSSLDDVWALPLPVSDDTKAIACDGHAVCRKRRQILT